MIANGPIYFIVRKQNLQMVGIFTQTYSIAKQTEEIKGSFWRSKSHLLFSGFIQIIWDVKRVKKWESLF